MSERKEQKPGKVTDEASHANVGFSGRHLMVGKVRDRFTELTGQIEVPADPLSSTFVATVGAKSVSSGDEARDAHLRGDDFFDVDNYKQWTLVSTGIESSGSDFILHTNLTIKDVTRPIDFALEFEGVVKDPWGNTKAGFTAEAEINRKDFGLEWNVALEAGGVLVGEKVKIVLEIEALKA